jgi:hypothetical protein
MDMIVTGARDIDFGSVPTMSVDWVLIFQNLADPSRDPEMREEGEENAKQLMSLVCPMNVSIRWGSALAMFHTHITLPVETATILPSGEKQQHKQSAFIVWNLVTTAPELRF